MKVPPTTRNSCLWMELYAVSAKQGKSRAFRWDKKFTQRERRAYPAEDRKLTPDGNQTTVDAFFRELTSRLDPPQYSYTLLRNYLEQANENDLRQPNATTRHAQNLVLLDDRRDPTGWLGTDGETYSARDWDGYSRYPPGGENASILLLNTHDLYKKQSRSVSPHTLLYPFVLVNSNFWLGQRLTDGAERRLLFVSASIRRSTAY